ncbi:MAG: response regulator, partial [Rhodocyclaceae bacterium]|nr:response regulator [Rhodocyclaceae bacterium]
MERRSLSDEDIPLPRVLIVDDSRMVRASISKNIRDRFDVREEADGEDGWQALLVDPSIQVVISDLGMPNLDGYGLLERIRSSKLSRIHELPVIIISGEEDDNARVKARELGATDFITKGIGNVELLSRLESLTRLARATRELEESREALASGSPIDPHSGLATQAYL